MKKIISILFSVFLFSTTAYAQYEEDVESIDSIIAALYGVISGEAGVERDWDRFKHLFIEDGVLMPTFVNQNGETGFVKWTPQDYINRAGPNLEENGFFESELNRRTEQFGNIAHVFSTYDSKRTIDGEVFARGINSIQLFNDGSRWWVVSVFWSSESEAHPIPGKYLGDN